MEQKDYGNLIAELAESREADRRQTETAKQQEQAALLARRRAVIQPAIDVPAAAGCSRPMTCHCRRTYGDES